ncbi:MHYT domain-containing protein [Planosporangium sp. 12N6]|uniref:MHYT domain-containing protein n=1 Tax=Planosporangium spinosum TaxID=3402278 RepID=UPI003CED1FAC
MAEVHHFAFGWINPTLAYVMSFLGSLLGLVLAGRAREVDGGQRARWLVLAAVAIGGTGIWLMHFMAMVGFDVPATVVRYDVLMTLASVVIAIVIVAIGLLVVGMGRPRAWKLLVGGPLTGLGVAAMHYTGMYAIHLGGVVSFDSGRVALSVVIAVVAATVALWFALVIRDISVTVAAALLMAAAVTSMHYVGMSAVRVRLAPEAATIDGVNPFVLLLPISILACVVITALAYATVGFTARRETRRETERAGAGGDGPVGTPGAGTGRADDARAGAGRAGGAGPGSTDSDGAGGAGPVTVPGQRPGSLAERLADSRRGGAALIRPRPTRNG